MDNETFATLVEVLAFECTNDPDKHSKFIEIFYGDYKNKGISFLHVDALHENHTITVMSHGKMSKGYLTAHEMTFDQERSYGYGNGNRRGGYRIKLDIDVQ